jgi:hypothetical protein
MGEFVMAGASSPVKLVNPARGSLVEVSLTITHSLQRWGSSANQDSDKTNPIKICFKKHALKRFTPRMIVAG